MTLKFILMVNKQGQTRLAEYFDFLSIEERTTLEAEIIRKCLSRTDKQVRLWRGKVGEARCTAPYTLHSAPSWNTEG